MSRCRCCNAPLSKYEIPYYNPKTGQEDDFCFQCRYLSEHSVVEKEYVGGNFPTSGVTHAKINPD